MSSITAIIPTYNRAGYLIEAVNALLAQTRRPDEIIVCDDGSTDATEAVAKRFGREIRYFRIENGGKSRALNTAMRQARGDLIWICDDDDLALPQAAEMLAGMLEAAPQAGISGGGYRRFRDGQGGVRSEEGPGYWPDLSNGSPVRHLLEDIFLFQNAMMVRRNIYDHAGPFREDLPRSIDYEMLIRLATLSPIVLTDAPLFLQRKHDGDRGPAGARHAAAKSEEVWKDADRTIFAEFRNRIPLDFYEAMFDADSRHAVARAALLQRACVHARRTDWVSAREDFDRAAAIMPAKPLCAVEQAICRRAMAGKHGIEEAMSPASRRGLWALSRQNACGASIANALVRGLAWRLKAAVRERDATTAARLLRLSSGLVSPISGRGASGLQTIERRNIPAAAFLSSWCTDSRPGRA
nr:glycosyltransferase family 2 protein [Limimaricola litoreus]